MTKEKIRSLVGFKRKDLSEATAEEHSRSIQERVIALDEFRSAGVVACYMAMTGEVRTDMIVSACRDAGKTVCVPVYNRKDKTYQMVILTGDSVMGSGPMGILEPIDGEVISMEAIEVVCVPGVAFDVAGRRVGHGGGHYDMLLRGEKQAAIKLGLGYEFQMFDNIPWWENDINMDLVITEDRVVRCPVRTESL